MSRMDAREVRHPVMLRLVEAGLIALITAGITSYANQAVLGERLDNLRRELQETKVRVDKIYRDIYCPYGRCPSLPTASDGGGR